MTSRSVDIYSKVRDMLTRATRSISNLTHYSTVLDDDAGVILRLYFFNCCHQDYVCNAGL